MFADAIKSPVHPATWAVIGLKRDALGLQISHRGTAFAVDKIGHLLTCWHVTYMDKDCTVECDELVVIQPELGAVQYPATVVAKEKDRDVALLEIQGGIATRPVTLVDGVVPFGRSCAAFGHPLSVTDPTTGSMRIFTRAAGGIVSTRYNAARWPGTRTVQLYELDFFTHGGSSGGAVFLRNGDVFAIVSGSQIVDDVNGNKTRSNLSICVDIGEAIQFLDPLNVKLQTRRSAK